MIINYNVIVAKSFIEAIHRYLFLTKSGSEPVIHDIEADYYRTYWIYSPFEIVSFRKLLMEEEEQTG